MTQQRKAHTGGSLFFIMALLYIGLVILFAWQTFGFVNWLFPSDQITMKILMVVCFDGMDLVWGLCDLFYHFAARSARTLVRFGWGVSFILSLLASVFYLVISSMFRFDIVLTQEQVNLGYGITIVAVVFQVVMLTFFLYIEWLVRHPYQDEYWDSTPALTATEMKVIENKIMKDALAQTSSIQDDLIAKENDKLLAEALLIQKSNQKKKRPRKLPVTGELGANTTPLP